MRKSNIIRVYPPPPFLPLSAAGRWSHHTVSDAERERRAPIEAANAVIAWKHVCRIKLSEEVFDILNDSAKFWRERTATPETVPSVFMAWRIMAAAREAVMNRIPHREADRRVRSAFDFIDREFARLGLLADC